MPEDHQKASLSETWRQARYDRARRPRRVYGRYHAPGMEPGGSVAVSFLSGVIVAALVGGALHLAEASETAIWIGVGACLFIAMYMANEQRWLTEEEDRRQGEAERTNDAAGPHVVDLSQNHLSAMIAGQERLAMKRDSQGRVDEAEAARRYADELRDELSRR